MQPSIPFWQYVVRVIIPKPCLFADVAQLVEHVIGYDEVSGSIPDIGSKIKVVEIFPFFSLAVAKENH